MKLGLLVETEEGLGWRSWRSLYSAAERLGFESIWVSDHLQSPWSASRHGLDPWIALAVAASDTQQILLGPLVSPVTFREPTIIARMAESIDALAPGRLVVGLGLGWNADEHTAAGIRFPSVTERSQRLEAAIDRIRCELGDRHIPILIGGTGARSTLPMVAQHADEWNVTTASPSVFASVCEKLEEACAAAGRDPREIRKSAAMGYLIGRDADDLAHRCKRLRKVVPPLETAADALQAARDMGWLVGTPEDMLSVLSEFAKTGLDRAILGHYDLSDDAALELIAERVIPRLP